MTRNVLTHTTALALLAMPSVMAHMAIWGDYVYGADSGPIYNPLRDLGFDQWVSVRVFERDAMDVCGKGVREGR
jgi:hypothetical protein